MKVGDTVSVYIYETLVYGTTRVLRAEDFDDDGDLDEYNIEMAIIEDGVDWNDCEVMSRETRIEGD